MRSPGALPEFEISLQRHYPAGGAALFGLCHRGKSMKRTTLRGLASAIAVACLVLPAFFMVGASKNASAETTATWTIGLYIDADNDFDTYWEGLSLIYLKNIPASAQVNIVAFVDREAYLGTELWEIEGSNAQIVETFPEMNFGDGATLSWMISQTAARYPSQHLLINAWDHGSAWNGFCIRVSRICVASDSRPDSERWRSRTR